MPFKKPNFQTAFSKTYLFLLKKQLQAFYLQPVSITNQDRIETKMKKLLFSITLFALSIPVMSKTTCQSFSTQPQAQHYYLAYNAYWLDRDNDGEACECLPGGSKYGKSVCTKRYGKRLLTIPLRLTPPRQQRPTLPSTPTYTPPKIKHSTHQIQGVLGPRLPFKQQTQKIQQMRLPEVIRINPLDADPTPYLDESPREAAFRNLPQHSSIYALSDVQIRSCPSKNCGSYGILPKSAHMKLSKDKQNFYYHKGWVFVRYYGALCFPENHTHQTGCLQWHNPVQATGWIYSGNLTF